MKSVPDSHRMDLYRQQMMDLYRQAAPSPDASTEKGNWLDHRYPEPHFERDKAALAPAVGSIEAAESPSFVGYLRVFVFSGGGAEPIVGARVVVSRTDNGEQTIYANLATDRDGFTPVLPLPSVDPALSLSPRAEKPYEAYNIRITADGFRPVEHQNVPVYGGNYVTQPVAMTPLLPGENNDDTQEFSSGGPTNL